MIRSFDRTFDHLSAEVTIISIIISESRIIRHKGFFFKVLSKLRQVVFNFNVLIMIDQAWSIPLFPSKIKLNWEALAKITISLKTIWHVVSFIFKVKKFIDVRLNKDFIVLINVMCKPLQTMFNLIKYW